MLWSIPSDYGPLPRHWSASECRLCLCLLALCRFLGCHQLEKKKKKEKKITSVPASLADYTFSSSPKLAALSCPHHPHSITHKSGYDHHVVLPHEAPHAMYTLKQGVQMCAAPKP